MDDKFFEDVFRKGLRNLEEKPDEGTWSSLEARLDGKRRSRRTIFIVLSAAAAIVGLFSYVAVQYGYHNLFIRKGETVASVTSENPLTIQEGPNAGVAPREEVTKPASERPGDDPVIQPEGGKAAARKPDAADDERSIAEKHTLDRPAWPGEQVAGQQQNNQAKKTVADSSTIKSSTAVKRDSTDREEPGAQLYGGPSPENQAEKEDEERKREFQLRRLELSGGPLYSYHNFVANPSDDIYVKGFQSSAMLSPERLGWQFNGGAEWSLTPRLNFFAGALYQHGRYAAMFSSTVFKNKVDANRGDGTILITPVDTVELVGYTQLRREMGGVIQLFYKLKAEKVSHSLVLGATLNRYRSRENFSGNAPVLANGYSAYMNVGYCVEYPFIRTLYIRFQPQYSFEIGNRNFAPSILNKSTTQYLSLQISVAWSVKTD